jgi:cytochrome d ubiquinol oxidase subunit I
VIGMPFSLEGFAFFLEAIFIGIYLYGWNRISPLAHWWSGVVVALSGVLSGIFVVCANGWMNTPAGFRMENGRAVDIDPFAAMFNAAAPSEVLHMTLAAFAAGFAVAGVHAFAILRGTPHRAFHRAALQIALIVGAAALLQPLSGDFSARVSRSGNRQTRRDGRALEDRPASFVIGGWIDEAALEHRGAIEIPRRPLAAPAWCSLGRGAGPRCRRPGGSPAGAHRTPRLPDHGRLRHADGRARGLDDRAPMAPPPRTWLAATR